MQTFKGVVVEKHSQLADALESGNRKVAEKVFAETTARYMQLYCEDDRKWFESFCRCSSGGRAPDL